ncbi:aminodeoxychorismate synthase component I [Vibrio sinensis]|uniref:aminodeoxychorismate synthase n=1 Tax=Vibrio sinensis TaxID=2302434 RepID=A0A3A6QG82_9VIBR|nr:aminodeoxychorismate synthase component I [Vibrio sinensis]RJX68362.1 aminodeoxychorismate synthase component I [Vibrio sinensis]
MNNNASNCIEIKQIEYAHNLALSLFSPIEHLSWAMLLRSASQTHIDARFDILVANPEVTLTTYGMETIVQRYQQSDTDFEQESTSHCADPFEILQSQLDGVLGKCQYQGELPFVGGALGYFAYDLGRRFESIPDCALKDLDTPDMAVGVYTWAVVVDHHRKEAFVVGKETESRWQWLVDQQGPNSKQPFTLVGNWQSNMSQVQYAEKFAAVQEYILAGDCYQINLAQRFTTQYQGSEWQAYTQLEAVNQAPFSAFIRIDNSAILSVSPERFLLVNQQEIETKPIKGTRPRHAELELDEAAALELSQAEKDQAENLMIVDLLRNDIGRVAKPGSVHVPKLFEIESFPAVHHLVSTIRAELDPKYSATDLLRASFPGGSITGAPKIRAMEIIEELEPHRRNAYCGSIGYISCHGRMDTSITIRTLVAEQSKLHVWAGGGLVADSQCEAEYQETFDKLSRILPVLSQ